MTILNVAEIGLTAGLLLATVVIYGFVPWWKTPGGRMLFAILLGFALVMGLVAASALFDDYPGRFLVRNIVYSITLLDAFLIFLLMISAQIKGRRKSKKAEEEREIDGME